MRREPTWQSNCFFFAIHADVHDRYTRNLQAICFHLTEGLHPAFPVAVGIALGQEQWGWRQGWGVTLQWVFQGPSQPPPAWGWGHQLTQLGAHGFLVPGIRLSPPRLLRFLQQIFTLLWALSVFFSFFLLDSLKQNKTEQNQKKPCSSF